MGENSPADTQVPEGVEVDAPATRVESPLQSLETTTVEQIPNLQPMENPTSEQVDVPWRKLQSVEGPSLSRFSGKICCPWGIHTGAIYF